MDKLEFKKKAKISEKLVLSSLEKTIPKTIAFYKKLNKNKSSERLDNYFLLLAVVEVAAPIRLSDIKNENKAMLDKFIKESKKIKENTNE